MSRYIDADALIKRWDEMSVRGRTEFDQEIMVAPSIDIDRSQEWIPCSEKLPSNFSEVETVLATTDVDGDRVIVMFALDVKSFYLKGYVTAWMPLPEPWKGADDEMR